MGVCRFRAESELESVEEAATGETADAESLSRHEERGKLMTTPATTGSGERGSAAILGPLAGVEVVSIAAGLLAAYLSLIFVGAQGMRMSPADTRDIYIGVAVASAVVGLLYWRALTSDEYVLTLGAGILLGVGCSLLAHPLTWLLALLINGLTGNPSGFLGTTWQGQSPAPVIELVGSVFFSIYSLIYVGWITSIVGGIVGGALAWQGARWRQGHSSSA